MRSAGKESGTHSANYSTITISASLEEISFGFSLNFPSAFAEHFTVRTAFPGPALSYWKLYFCMFFSLPELPNTHISGLKCSHSSELKIHILVMVTTACRLPKADSRCHGLASETRSAHGSTLHVLQPSLGTTGQRCQTVSCLPV